MLVASNENLTGSLLVENMTEAEIKRAQVVESVLPILREGGASS